MLADPLRAASALLGRPVATPTECEQALSDFIAAVGPHQDVALVRYFHHWLAQQNLLLQECEASAFLIGQNLQPIPDRP